MLEVASGRITGLLQTLSQLKKKQKDHAALLVCFMCATQYKLSFQDSLLGFMSLQEIRYHLKNTCHQMLQRGGRRVPNERWLHLLSRNPSGQMELQSLAMMFTEPNKR